MKQAGLIALVFLAAMGATWWLAGRLESMPGPAPQATPASAGQPTSEPSAEPEEPAATPADKPGGRRVRLEIVDEASGQPIAGATVTGLGAARTTDQEGRVELQDVPRDAQVRVRADGFDPEAIQISGAAVEAVPLRRTRLEIAVVDAESLEPCEGARLWLDGKPVALEGGQAEIDQPARGVHAFRAQAAGHFPYEKRRDVGSETVLLEIRLEPVRVEGEVRDAATGEPLAGATVTLLGHARTTGAGGGFVFSGLTGMEALRRASAQREARLAVACDGYEDKTVPVSSGSEAGQDAGEAEPAPGHPAGGIVLDVPLRREQRAD